ncbi:sugar transferase [Rubritalea marina]|uniref:sugar transferase n=1 Tax=Rubritalea marina TaxID=361055 RepID=UPI0003A4CE80|nr:sugar transferase [Rubritalea marina]
MKSPIKTQPLSGSIFAVTDEDVSKTSDFRRRFMAATYPFVLLLIDAAIIVLSFAVILYFHSGVEFFESVSRRVLVCIGLPSLLGVYLVGGYNPAIPHNSSRFFAEHIIAAVAMAVLSFGMIYSVISYGVALKSPRLVVGLTLVVFPVASLSYRYVLGRIQEYFERDNVICVIGAGTRARDLYTRLARRGRAHQVIPATFVPDWVGNHLIEDDPDSPVTVSIDQVNFEPTINGRYVERFVIATDTEKLPEEFSRKMVAALFHRHRIETYESYLRNSMQIQPPCQLSLNWPMLDGFRLNRSVSYDRAKRVMDISAALFGFLLASPFLIATAIAVKATSRGPILFKQQRTGFREEPFTIYKFRSMHVGAEKGNKYTQVNDSRLTPIGGFIRKTRLDELPQLWNVLIGDLSLIGPRAEWVDLVQGYEERFPFYHFRHAVKPGITGWAQVNYSYGANDEDTLEKLNYDLYYVRHYSMSLDVTIVVKTIYMMVFGKGM